MAAQHSLDFDLLITIDCLRADHMSFLGYEHPRRHFSRGDTEEAFA